MSRMSLTHIAFCTREPSSSLLAGAKIQQAQLPNLVSRRSGGHRRDHNVSPIGVVGESPGA